MQKFFIGQHVQISLNAPYHGGKIGSIANMYNTSSNRTRQYRVRFADGNTCDFYEDELILAGPAVDATDKSIKAGPLFRVIWDENGVEHFSLPKTEDEAIAFGKDKMLAGATSATMHQEIASFNIPVRVVDVQYY